MKILQYFSLLRATLKGIALLSLVAFLFGISSCDKGPTPEEEFLKKISKNWKSSSTGVQLDGKDVNVVFSGFTLTFTTGATYTSTNGNPPIWTATGKLSLKSTSNAAGFNIIRDDGVVVMVEQITDVKLVLKFPYVSKGARAGSVSGSYVFDLVVK